MRDWFLLGYGQNIQIQCPGHKESLTCRQLSRPVVVVDLLPTQFIYEKAWATYYIVHSFSSVNALCSCIVRMGEIFMSLKRAIYRAWNGFTITNQTQICFKRLPRTCHTIYILIELRLTCFQIYSAEQHNEQTVDGLTVSRISLRLHLQSSHFGSGNGGGGADFPTLADPAAASSGSYQQQSSSTHSTGLLLRCTAQVAELYLESSEVELGGRHRDPIPARGKDYI